MLQENSRVWLCQHVFECLHIPLLSNSSDVNWGPLSETIDSGNPYAANSFRSPVTVFSAVVLFIMRTCSHFEWLSAATKNIFPFFSAKSTCTPYHSHVLRGAAGGEFLCREHSEHLHTISSMSLSTRPPHETLGNVFHPHNSRMHCMQRMKQMFSVCRWYANSPAPTMHPSSRDGSSFRTKNGYISSSLAHDLGHPCRVWS